MRKVTKNRFVAMVLVFAMLFSTLALPVGVTAGEYYPTDVLSVGIDTPANLEFVKESGHAEIPDYEENPAYEGNLEIGEVPVYENVVPMIQDLGQQPVASIGEDAMFSAAFAPLSAGSVSPDPIIITPFHTHSIELGETFAWDVSLANFSPYPKVDIMYVVDTTGSMGSILPHVSGALSRFTADLVAAGAQDLQFGTAYYGDWDFDRLGIDARPMGGGGPGEDWFGITLELGNHAVPVVQHAIRNLPLTWGGDAPEDPLWAYMRTIHETNWRADAQRVVILITDQPTKIRGHESVGGFPVTFSGASGITTEYRITPLIMSFGSQIIGDISGGLGVPEYMWLNQTTLETRLRNALIIPSASMSDLPIEIKTTVTYLSDGAVSNDIAIAVSPERNFLLEVDALAVVNFTATVVNRPPSTRWGETVIADIGFYVDGIRFAPANQRLVLNMPDTPPYAFIYIQPDAPGVTTDFDGGQVRVPINIDSNPGLGAYSILAEISPDLMPYVNNITVEFGSVVNGFMNLPNTSFRPNAVLIGGASMGFGTVSHLDGTIATLVFDLKDDTPCGTYPIELEVRQLGGALSGGMPTPITDYIVTNGYIEILRAMLGDLDGDGMITVFDVQILGAYLVGDPIVLSPRQRLAADVNRDGIIDMLDLNILLRVAVGLQILSPDRVSIVRVGSAGSAAGFAAMSAMSFEGIVMESTAMSFESCVTVDDLSIEPMMFAMSSTSNSANVVSVPIAIQNNVGMSGFDIMLHYDCSLLKPIGHTPGSAWFGFNFFNSNTSGNYVRVIGVNWLNSHANGTIINVLFETLGTVTDVSEHVQLEVVELAQVSGNDVVRLGGYKTSGTEIRFGA